MTDQISIDVNPPSNPICPVGESQCGVIDQVLSLRQEVEQLAELVRTDTLTGLFNFRHFRHGLEQEMERTRRTFQTTALIMIDLDFFKKVNDNWGHEAGNQALISTAEVIRNTVRRLDIPCRYGGEEFTVILPATDLIIAIEVAQRLRGAIESTPVLVDGKVLNLTASLGVEVYTALQDDSPEQFVQRADSCLYQAKEKGRNQVCHGSVDMGSADAAISHEERDAIADFYGESKD